MVDATTASSISQVQSSYSDVNTALENLIGNMSSGSSYDAKSAIENLQNQLNNLSGTNPVGTVLAFSTNTIPNGYLLCNGASYDTSKYSHLYSALGTASVPDMRGMFLRGLDTSGSVDNYNGTRALLSFEEGSLLVKDSLNDSTTGFYTRGDNSNGNPSSNMNLGWDNSTATTNYSFAYSGAAGDNTNFSPTTYNGFGISRPKNIAVNYIIKAVP